MPGGGNSESSGSTSISGVSGPGQANGVISDAVSKDGGTSAAGNYGPGSTVAGSNGSQLPSVAEEKKKQSKSFWKKMLRK
ncbi:hypothetical protein Taro_020130 [Colocasia esculenta]|uniref:Uncharacterized protein n=1 Tax=Colocasia esculenta TaxID=4460 RepID=A0A843UMV7_COLES|nr:hypothetical protein [Colocasia esculenta]